MTDLVPQDETNLLPLRFYSPNAVSTNLEMAKMAFASGLLPAHIRSPQACLYIMQRGATLGLDPFFAVENTFLVNGRLMLSVHAFQAILASKGVRWDVKENSATRAEVVLNREGWAPITGVFTDEDAKRAGLSGKDSYRNHPADVLYANAFRKAARRIAADILLGISFVEDWELELSPRRDFDQQQTLPQLPEAEEPKPRGRPKKKDEAHGKLPLPQENSSTPTDPLPVGEPVAADPVQNVTYDNHGYHKCDEVKTTSDAPLFDYNDSDHRAFLSSVAQQLRIPNDWRMKNRDRILSALQTCPMDETAITQALKGLREAFP